MYMKYYGIDNEVNMMKKQFEISINALKKIISIGKNEGIQGIAKQSGEEIWLKEINTYEDAICILNNSIHIRDPETKKRCFEVIKQTRPKKVEYIIQGLSEKDYIIAYRCTEKGFYGGEWFSLDKKEAEIYKTRKQQPILLTAKIYKNNILTMGLECIKEILVENAENLEILEEIELN